MNKLTDDIIDGKWVMLRTLTERISYLPAGMEPLSADVGIIRGDRYDWIFDVGHNDEAACVIQGINNITQAGSYVSEAYNNEKKARGKKIVLSHFHQDHIGNIGRISCSEVYCGNITKVKVLQSRCDVAGDIIVPNKELYIEDGVRLCIFLLPSSHAKGSVALNVDDEYLFLGDATYCVVREGRPAYNVNALKDMIAVLKKQKAKYFMLSHDGDYIQPRDKVLEGLCRIYEMRRAGEAFIFKL